MVFLRPVVVRDVPMSAGLTADRYDIIRGIQGRAQPPDQFPLPPMQGPQLPEQLPPLAPGQPPVPPLAPGKVVPQREAPSASAARRNRRRRNEHPGPQHRLRRAARRRVRPHAAVSLRPREGRDRRPAAARCGRAVGAPGGHRRRDQRSAARARRAGAHAHARPGALRAAPRAALHERRGRRRAADRRPVGARRPEEPRRGAARGRPTSSTPRTTRRSSGSSTRCSPRRCASGASDVHIEPFEARSLVRLRIDGTLRDVLEPPRALHAAIVSRVKVMAQPRHRREAPAAGRPHHAAHRRAPGRRARLDAADRARRARGAAPARQAGRAGSTSARSA